MFSFGVTKANPVIPPPVISEIYFDSTGWFIELSYGMFIGNDSLRLISTNDTAYLTKGNYGSGDIRIVSQDSLWTPFLLLQSVDIIKLEIFSYPSSWIQIEEICWNNPNCSSVYNCNVNSPLFGQSLVWQMISSGMVIFNYWLVKANYPTPGFNDYYTSARGNFCGYLHDYTGKPIEKVVLKYCPAEYLINSILPKVETNPVGYFSKDMFAKHYDISFCYNSYPYDLIIDTTVSIIIEPDSINYYEFILDTLLTGIEVNPIKIDYSLSAFPNPTTGETTISFELPENYHFSKALIKIYNTIGEIKSIIPVEPNNSQNIYSVRWDNTNSIHRLPSGLYFCKLELDGNKVATTKIILSR